MTKLTLETIPTAIQEMAEKINRIERILSEKQSPPSTSKKVYTLPEAAKYCKIAVPTLRSFIYQRKISGSKIGGVWRFLEEDLSKFIADFRRPTEKELKEEAFTNLTR